MLSTVLDRLPFADRTKNENSDDAHPDCREDCADESTESALGAAAAAALDADQAVTDQPSRQAAEQDRDERGGSCSGRWKGGHRSICVGLAGFVGHPFIVGDVVGGQA